MADGQVPRVAAVPEAPAGVQAPAPQARPSLRVASVDVFRGAVMALMVFVNYLGEMPRAPAWTQHLPVSVDGYTLTDLVYPWFLFLVGVSIPLSLGRDGNVGRAVGRILPRAAALMLLGVVLENAHHTSAAATGMGASTWLALTLTAAVVLIWAPSRGARSRWWVVRAVDAAALLALLLLWRGERADGVVGPLAPSWGILGSIGWMYLIVATLFLVVRGQQTALVGVLGIFICISIGVRVGRYGPFWPLHGLVSVRVIFGSLAAVVVAGTVAGGWLRAPGRPTGRLMALGLGMCTAGWFLRPLAGYHKIAATPAFALVAAGEAALLLATLDLVVGRHAARWPAHWVALAGGNALLAYLLPDWLVAVSGVVDVDLMPWFERGGAAGMANAAVLTLAILALCALATRRGLVLRV
jgi:heparan-alpha-glucosaminide N-acetyltransferase